jgi:hypothetical protein
VPAPMPSNPTTPFQQHFSYSAYLRLCEILSDQE